MALTDSCTRLRKPAPAQPGNGSRMEPAKRQGDASSAAGRPKSPRTLSPPADPFQECLTGEVDRIRDLIVGQLEATPLAANARSASRALALSTSQGRGPGAPMWEDVAAVEAGSDVQITRRVLKLDLESIQGGPGLEDARPELRARGDRQCQGCQLPVDVTLPLILIRSVDGYSTPEARMFHCAFCFFHLAQAFLRTGKETKGEPVLVYTVDVKRKGLYAADPEIFDTFVDQFRPWEDLRLEVDSKLPLNFLHDMYQLGKEGYKCAQVAVDKVLSVVDELKGAQAKTTAETRRVAEAEATLVSVTGEKDGLETYVSKLAIEQRQLHEKYHADLERLKSEKDALEAQCRAETQRVSAVRAEKEELAVNHAVLADERRRMITAGHELEQRHDDATKRLAQAEEAAREAQQLRERDFKAFSNS